MSTYKEIKDYINEALKEMPLPKTPAGLYDPIVYTLASGGKRLRSVLLIAVAEAFGTSREHVINQALGIEIFHNFTLLHDDVMDRADVRRGMPTVHKRWNESTAILSGDAMLTWADVNMSHCDSSKISEVLSLYHRTAMEIYEGQQLDMDFEERTDVTVAEYMEMIRLKTAVLLGCACEIGTIMAGASTVKRKAFYSFGQNLGLAFQLQDDYLDTYGDPKIFGKEIGGDIRNDKKNYLLAKALEKGGEETRGMVVTYLGQRGDDKVMAYKSEYAKLGVDTDCEILMRGYVDKALEALDTIGLDDEWRSFFADIALSSLNRQS